MGHHICQYGVVHRTCRCPKEHRINCDTPDACKERAGMIHPPKHRKEDGHADARTAR